MAVQADHHLSNTTNTFSHGFRARALIEAPESFILLNNVSESDLTSNAPVISKKRARGEETVLTQQTALMEQNRFHTSTGTSTSGRYSAAVSQDQLSNLYHQQCVETDMLLRVHADQLRSGMETLRKRHCRNLLSVVEQHAAKKMRGMQLELEMANKRNIELEEKVRQAVAENLAWFNVAKNNETMAFNLKSMLDQALIQARINAVPVVEEGYGDSAGDAESCCYEGLVRGDVEAVEIRRENEELRRRRACKACWEGEVCVLLLPCKHLCLCRDCESKIDSCPVCNTAKSACLLISMS